MQGPVLGIAMLGIDDATRVIHMVDPMVATESLPIVEVE